MYSIGLHVAEQYLHIDSSIVETKINMTTDALPAPS